MSPFRSCVPYLLATAIIWSPVGASAQAPAAAPEQAAQPAGEQQPAAPTATTTAEEPAAAQAADVGTDEPRGATALIGPPPAPFYPDAASNRPECRWTGQRIVSLLWRDDINTALQHLQIYNTFGCPEEQLRVVFACLIRQGDFDPQGKPALAVRILSCWTNPAASLVVGEH